MKAAVRFLFWMAMMLFFLALGCASALLAIVGYAEGLSDIQQIVSVGGVLMACYLCAKCMIEMRHS